MLNLLDPFLKNLRVSGSILLSEAYAAPWAIAIPEAGQLGAVLGVAPSDHLFIFHYVRKGGFDFVRSDEPAIRVQAGEVGISIAGQAHVMREGRGAIPVDAGAVLSGQASPPLANGDEGATVLICGAFMLHPLPLDPLMSVLPPVMKLDLNGLADDHSLRQIAALLTAEVASGSRNGFTTLRLLEIFCAQALSLYCQHDQGHGSGWLRLIADKRLSPALTHIHDHPDQAHTVESLAKCVALSPSRFAARFRESFGHSVMSYVTQVRVHMACRLINDTDQCLTDIAEQCGYHGLPGFCRSFKALIGLSPAAWRNNHRKAQA